VRALTLLIYWLVLFAATHYPRVPLPHVVSYSDKIYHLVAFGLLALLAWRALEARAAPSGPRIASLAAGLVVYAAIDEYTQQFVGRGTDPLDFAADATGIALVLVVLSVRWRAKRSLR
jgi:VanZ family protein